MMPREGAVIADRYRLERKVGGGRVAAVWRVQDEVTEGTCAIKLLHRSMHKHAEALTRFSLEDRLARELTGPYFPERIGSGTWDSMRYIAWRWYEGECLRSLFERNPKQDAPTVHSIVQETCQALNVVHAAGYTHGDLKPENLFFADRGEHDPSRQLKLFGFGVASRISPLSANAALHARRKPGQLVGTPLYLSPDLILGRPPRGGQADLWALAVIVYEALTGRVPFLGPDLAGVLDAILERRAPKPSSLAENLPRTFDLWWAQANEQAFNTPTEFATGLARALAPALRSSHTQRSAALPERSMPPVEGPAPLRIAAGRGGAASITAAGLGPTEAAIRSLFPVDNRVAAPVASMASPAASVAAASLAGPAVSVAAASLAGPAVSIAAASLAGPAVSLPAPRPAPPAAASLAAPAKSAGSPSASVVPRRRASAAPSLPAPSLAPAAPSLAPAAASLVSAPPTLAPAMSSRVPAAAGPAEPVGAVLSMPSDGGAAQAGTFAPLPSPLSDFNATVSRKTLLGITPPAALAASLAGLANNTGGVTPSVKQGGRQQKSIEGAPCKSIDVSGEAAFDEAMASAFDGLRRPANPTVPYPRPRVSPRNDTLESELDELPELGDLPPRAAAGATWRSSTTRTLRLVLTSPDHKPQRIAGIVVCAAAAVVIFLVGRSPVAGTEVIEATGIAPMPVEAAPPASPTPSILADPAVPSPEYAGPKPQDRLTELVQVADPRAPVLGGEDVEPGLASPAPESSVPNTSTAEPGAPRRDERNPGMRPSAAPAAAPSKPNGNSHDAPTPKPANKKPGAESAPQRRAGEFDFGI